MTGKINNQKRRLRFTRELLMRELDGARGRRDGNLRKQHLTEFFFPLTQPRNLPKEIFHVKETSWEQHISNATSVDFMFFLWHVESFLCEGWFLLSNSLQPSHPQATLYRPYLSHQTLPLSTIQAAFFERSPQLERWEIAKPGERRFPKANHPLKKGSHQRGSLPISSRCLYNVGRFINLTQLNLPLPNPPPPKTAQSTTITGSKSPLSAGPQLRGTASQQLSRLQSTLDYHGFATNGGGKAGLRKGDQYGLFSGIPSPHPWRLRSSKKPTLMMVASPKESPHQ